ncbi:RNA-binding cell elongation regulator Jag/EloR [Bacillota bacterium Meth-B3]
MISIEKSGKTVEDAVQAGLHELKKDSSEVTIDVLEYGSPGLFGMFGKLARVRLTVKQEPELDFEMPVFSLDQQPPQRRAAKPEPKAEPKAETRPEPKPEPAPAPKQEARKPEPRPEPARQAQPEQAKPRQPVREPRAEQPRAPRPPRKPRAPREEPRREPMPPATAEDLPPLDVDALGPDGKTAYEFLARLTQLMGAEVEIRIRESEGHLAVQMIGDTLGVLIGRHGDTLDALQYLTSLQVNKGRSEYLRVTLDTEYYRAKREEALRRLAERMANRVRKTGHRVALEPMNPYERRVLHSALQNHSYVTTHSEGEEPYRRVIITPR